MSSGDHPLKADLLLVLATLVAAAGWIFSKEALAGMPPLQFVGVRFLLAGVVLAALGWNQLRALDRAGLRGSLLVGTLFAMAMAFWIKGLEHARHLGEGAFISSLGIVLVPLIGRLFFGDRPPRLTWVAMPVALGGFACLSLEHGFRFEPGQWFFIAAAVVFAILLNLNSRVVRNVSPLALSAIQVSMVGGLMLPLSALRPHRELARRRQHTSARLAAGERPDRDDLALLRPALRPEPDHAQPRRGDPDARADVDRHRRGVVVWRAHDHPAVRRLWPHLRRAGAEPLALDSCAAADRAEVGAAPAAMRYSPSDASWNGRLNAGPALTLTLHRVGFLYTSGLPILGDLRRFRLSAR